MSLDFNDFFDGETYKSPTSTATIKEIMREIKGDAVKEYKIKQLALKLIQALQDDGRLLYYHGEDGLYWEERKLRVTQEELDLVYAN